MIRVDNPKRVGTNTFGLNGILGCDVRSATSVRKRQIPIELLHAQVSQLRVSEKVLAQEVQEVDWVRVFRCLGEVLGRTMAGRRGLRDENGWDPNHLLRTSDKVEGQEAVPTRGERNGPGLQPLLGRVRCSVAFV